MDRSAQFGGRLRYFLKGKDRPDPDCWSFVAKLLSRRAEPFIQGPAALFRERLSSCSVLRLIQLLTLLFECLVGVSAGCAATKVLRSQGAFSVRTLALAAMIAAMTSGRIGGT